MKNDSQRKIHLLFSPLSINGSTAVVFESSNVYIIIMKGNIKKRTKGAHYKEQKEKEENDQ